ncbi:MAG: substrate-binding periplasmic protein [Pseudomonadota bacterium]
MMLRVPFAGLLWLVCGWAQAALSVVTYPIPVHVESERSGLFVELTQAVAATAGIPVKLTVMPPPRAVQAFLAGQQHVLFPALEVLFPDPGRFVRSSEPIDCKEDFVFTRAGAPKRVSLADLKGLRVGVTRGYPYAREVLANTSYTLEHAVSDEANIRKLMAGHIDAFILDEKTGVKAFAKLGLAERMQYQAGAPVSRQAVFYAFQPTPAGRRQAEAFSRALLDMKKDGRYRRITRGITFEQGCAD